MGNSAIKKLGIGVLCLIPVITALAGLNRYWKKFDFDKLSADPAEWGQFGDFIGGIVNPSVGLVTIILLVLTLLSQQKELREQRMQAAKQSFEQTFFAWIDNYRQSVRDMTARVTVGDVEIELRGLQVMEHMIDWDRDLDEDLKKIEDSIAAATTIKQRRAAKTRLVQLDAATWNSKGRPALEAASTPARIANSLLSYLDLQTHMSEEERQRYSDIFQSSIGGIELSFYFLSNSHGDQPRVLKLYAQHSFLYFLNPVHRPLIAALMRHRAHKFAEVSFSQRTLRMLRDIG